MAKTTASQPTHHLWECPACHTRMKTGNVGAAKGHTLRTFCPDPDCGSQVLDFCKNIWRKDTK